MMRNYNNTSFTVLYRIRSTYDLPDAYIYAAILIHLDCTVEDFNSFIYI